MFLIKKPKPTQQVIIASLSIFMLIEINMNWNKNKEKLFLIGS